VVDENGNVRHSDGITKVLPNAYATQPDPGKLALEDFIGDEPVTRTELPVEKPAETNEKPVTKKPVDPDQW
jgi:hypothetical protein